MWRARSITFVNATVLDGCGRTFGSVRVRGGLIDSVGDAPHARDRVIDLGGAIVLPGLINAHDHLELNSFGRLKWRDRYANVREWIADFQPQFRSDPALADARPDTLADRLWVSALKNLLSGVTTVCHHNPLHPGLTRGYPIRVLRKFSFSHSLQVDADRIPGVYRRTPGSWPWIVHAAEGVDARAAGEIDALDALGCLENNTVIVHGVALSAERAARVIDRGGALVWCPTSNHFLFGTTADVRPFDAAGRLAIGSDSRLSGEGDLLDEIRAAYATRQITPHSLFRAVTSGAARVLRIQNAGDIRPGVPADLCVLAASPDPLDALVSARRRDVRLTMVGGRPLVSDPDLAPLFDASEAGTPVVVDGVPKLLNRRLAERAACAALTEPGLELVTC